MCSHHCIVFLLKYMCWLGVRSSYRMIELSADCTLQAGVGAAGLDYSEAVRRFRHEAV